MQSPAHMFPHAAAILFSFAIGGFAAVPVAPTFLPADDAEVDCYCTATHTITDSGNLVGLTAPSNSPEDGGCRNQGNPAACTLKARQCEFLALNMTYTAPSGGVYYQTKSGGSNTSGSVSCNSCASGTVNPGLGCSCQCGLSAECTTYIYTTNSDCTGDSPPSGAGAIGWVKVALSCANCNE